MARPPCPPPRTASQLAQRVKNPPLVQVRSPAWEDPLEAGMATHSSILAWRTPWAEEPGGSTAHAESKQPDTT